MKKARKLITFILTVVMVLSMSMNVWAEGEAGTITITNAKKDTTYSVYKMLELVSFSEGENKYSYRVTADWEEFINDSVYFKVDEHGYVTWKGSEEDEAKALQAATVAKEALVYAETHGIAPTLRKTSNADAELSITDLELGYYLVDSTRGVLCSLNTTDTTVEITEKNEAPVVDKKIEITQENYESTNTANFGDTVKFRTQVTIKPGAKGYVLHDTMDEGFELLSGPVVEGFTGYIINRDSTDGCAFEITFNENALAGVTEDTIVTITYSAKVKTTAVVGGEGNKNTTYLEYGEAPWVDTNGDGEPDTPANPDDPNKPTTTPVYTTTFTYKFSLVKTDGDNKLLNGAIFDLYDAQTEGSQIKLVHVKDNVYRVATDDDPVESHVSITAGTAVIQGLANGEYYLQETKEPQGYNKLTSRVKVKIEDVDKVIGSEEVDDNVYGVQVINNTGSELPSTGGIGTTIFYIVGGALVLFAVVLLVTKKRMKDTQ